MENLYFDVGNLRWYCEVCGINVTVIVLRHKRLSEHFFDSEATAAVNHDTITNLINNSFSLELWL